MKWKVFFQLQKKEQANEFNPLYYYLAQISAEVRQLLIKKEVPIENHLLKFTFKNEKKKMKKIDSKEKMKISKLAWFSLLNSARKNKNKRKR